MELIREQIGKRYTGGRDACRLFHGRGHCFPGYEDLVIDWYCPVVMVILYRQRDACWLSGLVTQLQSTIPEMSAVVLQERYVRGAPSRILWGRVPHEVDAREAGLSYRLRLLDAQNIGFFPDMKQGRAVVKANAAGRRILNLFAYTCGFSVAALAGGASQVVNLDMSRSALELGRLNHQLNNCDMRKVSFLRLELFRSFSRLRKLDPFDLGICDPPAQQGHSFRAERDWPKLVDKIPTLLRNGGELLACRSCPELTSAYLRDLFSERLPTGRLLGVIHAGDMFPESDAGKGLEILHYRLE